MRPLIPTEAQKKGQICECTKMQVKSSPPIMQKMQLSLHGRWHVALVHMEKINPAFCVFMIFHDHEDWGKRPWGQTALALEFSHSGHGYHCRVSNIPGIAGIIPVVSLLGILLADPSEGLLLCIEKFVSQVHRDELGSKLRLIRPGAPVSVSFEIPKNPSKCRLTRVH